MACFLVPTATAAITKVVEKKVEKKEKESADKKNSVGFAVPWSKKLKWLNGMYLGGAGLLAFEHLWHGEVVPWFPFLTAASNPSDMAETLHEMSTVGVCMALLILMVWGGMCIIADHIAKRSVANEEVIG